ncbi:MAG: hypothetical protein PHR26_01380 [Candidatus ainarchaeum sp.]|nr:hypothetical protein [Candidatus ainarchaeum sp.]MDD3976290.1 hypothetical protein [Candidatus ainarchaeum sp.]
MPKTNKILYFGILTLPIWTIIYATNKSPFDYTLSMIGNWFDYRINFIIWGIVTGILFTLFLINLFKKTNFNNKKSKKYAYLTGIYLILTVLTPISIQEPIDKALRVWHIDLHVVWSVLFAFSLITCLYMFSKYLKTTHKQISIRYSKYMIFTIFGSLLLLTLFGMTGIFELFFFISVTFYMIILDYYIDKIN